MKEYINDILVGNSVNIMETIQSNYVHLILSDIPYGISYDTWDIIHNNTNSALLGSSPAQKKAGTIFKHRGKPLNGWSEKDRKISEEYYNWCASWSSNWIRVMKPGASAFIFAGRRYAHKCISAMEDSGFIFKDMIAWEKESAPYRSQRISLVYDRRNDEKNSAKWEGWRLGNLRPVFEPILWFMKPYKIGGTIATNVVDFEVGAFNSSLWSKYSKNHENIIRVKTHPDDTGYHPTQKPLDLLKALIELTTIESQIVLDPFCGSGSTLVAAKALNRNYIGIEQSYEYARVAEHRLSMLT